jgi:hypothetical protein
MGRYCSFNTGVEVPTDVPVDLATFGGSGRRNDITGYNIWQWDATRDGNTCLKVIRYLEKKWGLPHVAFAEFALSARGNAELWAWLHESKGSVPADVFAAWLVGCVIYHQLQWCPHLMGEW